MSNLTDVGNRRLPLTLRVIDSDDGLFPLVHFPADRRKVDFSPFLGVAPSVFTPLVPLHFDCLDDRSRFFPINQRIYRRPSTTQLHGHVNKEHVSSPPKKKCSEDLNMSNSDWRPQRVSHRLYFSHKGRSKPVCTATVSTQ